MVKKKLERSAKAKPANNSISNRNRDRSKSILELYEPFLTTQQFPLSEGTLDLLCERIAKNCLDGDIINLTELFHSVDLSRATGDRWVIKYPKFAKVIRDCMEIIGMRRYKGVTKGIYKSDFLRVTQYYYQADFDFGEQRRQKMQQDAPQNVTVVIPDDLKFSKE